MLVGESTVDLDDFLRLAGELEKGWQVCKAENFAEKFVLVTGALVKHISFQCIDVCNC